jgi:hypothetical protein
MTSTTKRRMKMNDVKIESISTLVLGKDDIVVVNFPPSNLPPSKLEESMQKLCWGILKTFLLEVDMITKLLHWLMA